MNLAHLSGDIFARIARFNEASPAILALWKCGDAVLSKKICEYVDEIDLEDQNSDSTSRYPKFLSSLSKLRVLRLVRFASLGPNTVLSSELQKLPSTLTELTVSAYHSLDPFFAFSDSELGSDCDLEGRPTDAASSYWNWSLKFPHLRKLVVEECFWYPDGAALNDALLSVLPPTLEHLELPHCSMNVDTLRDHLPLLHTLKLSSLRSTTKWPPHLTRLNGALFLKPAEAAELYENLPRTLTAMPECDPLLYSPHLLSLLPPALTELKLPAVSDIHSIPSSLSSLTKLSILDPEPLRAADLLALPPGLTSLNIGAINWKQLTTDLDRMESEIDFDSFWPRNLRHLKIERELDSKQANTRLHKVFGALPSTLTSLHGIGSWANTGLDWHCNPFSNLKSLTLTQETSFPHSLPPTIETLRMKSIDFIPGCFNFLRTSSSLTTLHLGITLGAQLPPIPLTAFFECVPPSLTNFSFGGFEDEDAIEWTSEGMSLLPTSLTELELDFFPAPPSSVMRRLPIHLTRFKAMIEIPTPEDVLAMPCYHRIRSIDLFLPQYEEMIPELEDVWPPAALSRTHFDRRRPVGHEAMFDIVKKNKEYPDSRTLTLHNRSNKVRPRASSPVSSRKSSKSSSDGSPYDDTEL